MSRKNSFPGELAVTLLGARALHRRGRCYRERLVSAMDMDMRGEGGGLRVGVQLCDGERRSATDDRPDWVNSVTRGNGRSRATPRGE